ncbi:hypothetical protein EVAR_55784_1 [Eumeta japonica]|uniref:Uncharacterized protein n=1 Tax=Eumeta variegata TaxID=151549 RepID=A0A4C1YTM2_EUMVA|nr:hypothetical protein EVAR_55784_1 [Eumeta japonica]
MNIPTCTYARTHARAHTRGRGDPATDGVGDMASQTIPLGHQVPPQAEVTKDTQTSPISAASYYRIVVELRLMGVDGTESDGDEKSNDEPYVRRKSKKKERESPAKTKQLPKTKKVGAR